MNSRIFYDIRTYELKPEQAEEFHRLATEVAIPMLHRFGIDVVSWGPSVIDPSRYLLIRAFPSLETRQEQLDAFYGSAEWLEQLDDQVMSMVETYHVVVVSAEQAEAR